MSNYDLFVAYALKMIKQTTPHGVATVGTIGSNLDIIEVNLAAKEVAGKVTRPMSYKVTATAVIFQMAG